MLFSAIPEKEDISDISYWQLPWWTVYDNDLNSTDACLPLNHSENSTNLFNQFNDFPSNQKQNSDNIRNCKYYNIDKIQSLNKLNDKHSPSLFQINACSLSKNIENLELLLNLNQICFSVITMIETRIVKNKFPVNVIT